MSGRHEHKSPTPPSSKSKSSAVLIDEKLLQEAGSGNKEAQFKLAVLLFQQKNYDAAYAYFAQLASYNPRALTYAIDMINGGLGLGQISKKDALFQLTLSLYKANNYGMAFTYFKHMQDVDARAFAHLGKMTNLGQGTPRNPKAALEFYLKGAEKNDPTALFELGVMYKTGEPLYPVKRNLEHAGELFARAVYYGNGFPEALRLLKDLEDSKKIPKVTKDIKTGMDYLYGSIEAGIPIDYEKARVIFEKDASALQPEAFYGLYLLYSHPRYPKRNQSLASTFRTLAEVLDNPNALRLIHASKLYDDFSKRTFLRALSIPDKGSEYSKLITDSRDKILLKLNALKLETDAKAGVATAQVELATKYLEGDGYPQNYQEALRFFQSAAAQGNPIAQYQLSIFYRDGLAELKQDDAKAVEWCERAAKAGDMYAQFDLAQRYENGQGVSQNDLQAIQWYSVAAKQGLARANYAISKFAKLGEEYLASNNDAKAFEYFKITAAAGIPSAIHNVAWMQEVGRAAKESTQATLDKMYDKAASLGSMHAQYKVAQLHDVSVHHPEYKANAMVAFIMYRKAAAQGHAEAKLRLKEIEELVKSQDAKETKTLSPTIPTVDTRVLRVTEGVVFENIRLLGEQYLLGDGVKKNAENALECFRLAAMKGDKQALTYVRFKPNQAFPSLSSLVEKEHKGAIKLTEKKVFEDLRLLAEQYILGEGVIKNHKTAFEYIRIAATKGDGWALTYVLDMPNDELPANAELLSYVETARRNETQQRLKASQNASVSLAQDAKTDVKRTPSENVKLGEKYLLGLDVAPDEKKAFEYFRLAGNEFDPRALNYLGVMYKYGLAGEAADPSASMSMFRMAADRGNIFSHFHIGQYYDVSFDHAQYTEHSKLAINMYTKAAAQGHVRAQQRLNEMAKVADVKVAEELKISSVHPSMASQDSKLEAKNAKHTAFENVILGEQYLLGDGVPQSDEKALEHFHLAAEKGDSWGKKFVTEIDDQGRFTRIALIRVAAERGNPSAQFKAGEYYNVDANHQHYKEFWKRAAEMYTQAAAQGHPEAKQRLDEMKITSADQKSEKEIMAPPVSAVARDAKVEAKPTAKPQPALSENVILGEKYLLGDGVDQSDALAAEYFRKAAEESDDWGFTYVAEIDGNDQFDRILMLQIAADRGNMNAQFKVGEFYDVNSTHPQHNQHSKRANEMFRKAAAQGHPDAIDRLKNSKEASELKAAAASSSKSAAAVPTVSTPASMFSQPPSSREVKEKKAPPKKPLVL